MHLTGASYRVLSINRIGRLADRSGRLSHWHITRTANWWIYLFGFLRRFQHCTGHITTGSWKGRGNQYCKLPTNGKQLPAFRLEDVPGIEPRPQRWEARVLQLCHRGPSLTGRKNGPYLKKVHQPGTVFLG